MKKELLKHDNPFIIEKKGENFKIKGEVDEYGKRRVTIHKRRSDNTFWDYTTYVLGDDGGLYIMKSGKYPTSFGKKK